MTLTRNEPSPAGTRRFLILGAWALYDVANSTDFVIVPSLLLRGMYARLVPPAQAAEFFGFNVLTGRLSAALGPLLFSAVNTVVGTPKAGLLSLIAFLTAGALILSGVRLPDPADSN